MYSAVTSLYFECRMVHLDMRFMYEWILFLEQFVLSVGWSLSFMHVWYEGNDLLSYASNYQLTLSGGKTHSMLGDCNLCLRRNSIMILSVLLQWATHSPFLEGSWARTATWSTTSPAGPRTLRGRSPQVPGTAPPGHTAWLAASCPSGELYLTLLGNLFLYISISLFFSFHFHLFFFFVLL